MLENWQSQPASERIIIALDCDADKALSIAYQLRERARWVKIGMTLYYAYGKELVSILKSRGYNVFLDLKFFDIPHQVRGAAKSAAQSGADMLTMHASGGEDMMKQARLGLEEAFDCDKSKIPATLGITVLTSMNDETLRDVGISRDMQSQVSHLAKLAKKSGLDGVVASGHEAKMLRDELGEKSLIVTPGIRPLDASVGDQSRVVTPEAAFASGASHIVIGRPITDADDPISAFENIAEGLI